MFIWIHNCVIEGIPLSQFYNQLCTFKHESIFLPLQHHLFSFSYWPKISYNRGEKLVQSCEFIDQFHMWPPGGCSAEEDKGTRGFSAPRLSVPPTVWHTPCPPNTHIPHCTVFTAQTVCGQLQIIGPVTVHRTGNVSGVILQGKLLEVKLACASEMSCASLLCHDETEPDKLKLKECVHAPSCQCCGGGYGNVCLHRMNRAQWSPNWDKESTKINKMMN